MICALFYFLLERGVYSKVSPTWCELVCGRSAAAVTPTFRRGKRVHVLSMVFTITWDGIPEASWCIRLFVSLFFFPFFTWAVCVCWLLPTTQPPTIGSLFLRGTGDFWNTLFSNIERGRWQQSSRYCFSFGVCVSRVSMYLAITVGCCILEVSVPKVKRETSKHSGR